MNSGQADTFVVFTVAGTSYALPSRDVQHMEMIENVTRVPNAPPHVDGVVFSRGQVVPAVNLRARFGWLSAPRSTVLQPGPIHGGLTADPAAELERLMDRMVR